MLPWTPMHARTLSHVTPTMPSSFAVLLHVPLGLAQADLAALYPGLQLDGGPDTPPLTGGAKMQPLNAA